MNKRVAISILLLLLGSAGGVRAENPDLEREKRTGPPNDRGVWSIAFENDVLAGGNRDKDYTFGLNLTYTGPRAADFALSPYRLQEPVDRWLLPDQPEENHSLEFGFYGFTPDDIDIAEPIVDDRPYASLIYLQSVREQVDPARGESWTSSLSVGVLGLDLVGSSQNRAHDFTGSNEALGWDHQISDGGELTAKYSLAYQKSWLQGAGGELKTTGQVSVGYITEASVGVSFRRGRIRSSWWSFDPELAAYGERSSPFSSSGRVTEHYLWGGVALKARAYNVFLQGQFRESDVSFDSDQLHHLLVEGWLGYTMAFDGGLRVSYWLRGHSSEIRDGEGDRGLVWGGIIVSKSF
ncbi:lipid A deacylase LpxR family protein [Gilvimarinus sp. F26214L]|uniref:lipid A deacylase LpxR family protein n=1 Tax=Gilvimarinus sp. DZF01 TaxID=3461371 RepID=UPI00404681C0